VVRERADFVRVPATGRRGRRNGDLRVVRADQHRVHRVLAKFVPETRGRTLEELQDEFRTHDAAHLVDPAPVGVHGS